MSAQADFVARSPLRKGETMKRNAIKWAVFAVIMLVAGDQFVRHYGCRSARQQTASYKRIDRPRPARRERPQQQQEQPQEEPQATEPELLTYPIGWDGGGNQANDIVETLCEAWIEKTFGVPIIFGSVIALHNAYRQEDGYQQSNLRDWTAEYGAIVRDSTGRWYVTVYMEIVEVGRNVTYFTVTNHTVQPHEGTP